MSNDARDDHTLGFRPLPDEQDAAGGDAHTAIGALAGGDAAVVVTSGHRAGSRYALAADMVTAGRHPESHIFLDDITVSRRHVEFHRHEGGWELRDVGSLNGTYLNGERVDAATVHNGDDVQIGKFKLVFLVGRGEAAGTAGNPGG